jgi:hypothetical protein
METPPIHARSFRQWKAQATIRVASGESGSLVAAEMDADGIDPQVARATVEEVIRRRRTSAIGLLVGGLGFAALAFVVTVASLLLATRTSNQFWIWYGPMVIGPIVAIVGLVRLLKVRW